MAHFDQSAFEKLRDKVLADIAGAMGAFMAFIGDQTGVYKALERRGRCRPEELATLAGVDPRYLARKAWARQCVHSAGQGRGFLLDDLRHRLESVRLHPFRSGYDERRISAALRSGRTSARTRPMPT